MAIQASDDDRGRVAELNSRLEGRLVVLEPLSLAHERGLFDAARDGELFAWLPDELGASREQLRDWLERSIEAGAAGIEVPFAIVSAATGAPVGSSRFQEVRLEHLRVEIGWTWRGRSSWGTGINVEAKLLLLARAFEHVGCRRVEFKTDARNERSRGARGARFEGVFRKHMVVLEGGVRDSAYYSVIDDEWPEVKARLEQRLERLPAVRSRCSS